MYSWRRQRMKMAGRGTWHAIGGPMAALALMLLIFQLHAAAAAKTTFDPMTHNISPVTQQTWYGKVTASRTARVFCVLFYKDNCPRCQQLIDGEFNAVAKNLNGMITMLAANCDQNPKLCKDEKVTDFPSLVVYPLMPMPPVPYKGKMSVPAITNFVSRFIPSSLIIPKDINDFKTAMSGSMQLPKILIFSDKPEPSNVFRALSTSFKDSMQLFYLNVEKFADLKKKYKVEKLPHVVVTKKDAKDSVYTGEFRFQALFDWMNIFSETFAKGGGFSDTESVAEASAETHPWRFQEIPELTKLSSSDLCFKKTLKALCVIYLKEGRSLSGAETDMLEGLKHEYESSSSSKGADYRWMWMDLATETAFKELFQKDRLPSLVVFNPHLKTRYTSLDADEVTKASVKALLEKIALGNARFKVVPTGKMPTWADRKEEPKSAPKKEKDEL